MLQSTFIRFLVAGVVNTLFGWIVYSAAFLAGLDLWACLLLGVVAGIAFNFFSIGGYAFRQLDVAVLPRFVAAYALIYATNLVCLTFLAFPVESPILKQLVLTPPMAIVSFVLMSRFVFTRRRPPRAS